MNEERYLRKLADRARWEPPPKVDVADRVMAAVRAQQAARATSSGPMAWIAGLAAAAAVPVAIMGATAWQAYTDPLLSVVSNSVPWEGLL